jgi:hypothetical protein
MVKEDTENKIMIGALLQASVRRLFQMDNEAENDEDYRLCAKGDEEQKLKDDIEAAQSDDCGGCSEVEAVNSENDVDTSNACISWK